MVYKPLSREHRFLLELPLCSSEPKSTYIRGTKNKQTITILLGFFRILTFISGPPVLMHFPESSNNLCYVFPPSFLVVRSGRGSVGYAYLTRSEPCDFFLNGMIGILLTSPHILLVRNWYQGHT